MARVLHVMAMVVFRDVAARVTGSGRQKRNSGEQVTRPTELQQYRDEIETFETLRTLKPLEKQILSNDGRGFTVRIMPYPTLDSVVDGVVITLVDITATKETESVPRQHST